MRISAKRTENGTFVLHFDNTEVTLSAADLRSLLLQITRILTPDAMKADKDVEMLADAIGGKVKDMNDVGVQHFIQAADDEDILVLLKLGEEDDTLLNKLYGNMSDHLATVFEEDVGFKYGNGMPDSLARSAVKRLNATMDRLRADGLIHDG